MCLTYSVPVPVATAKLNGTLPFSFAVARTVQIGSQDTPNNGTADYMPSDVRAFRAKTLPRSLAQVVRLRTNIQEVPDSHLGRDTNCPGGFFVPFLRSSHVLGYCPKIKAQPILSTSVLFILYHYSIIRRSEVWGTAMFKQRLPKKSHIKWQSPDQS